MEADHERRTGAPFDESQGVILASDVLIELHGDEAAWARWVVIAIERLVRQHMAAFAAFLPAMLVGVTCFWSYQASRGRVPEGCSVRRSRAA